MTNFQSIELPNSDIVLYTDIDFGIASENIFKRLIEETPWEQKEIVIHGKEFLQPRLIAWYGDEGCNYGYSGTRLTTHPWTDLLLTIKATVEEITNTKFNSVLLNYYRDGKDSIGFHSDNERELGYKPVIASVSFGEPREFIFKPKPYLNLKIKKTILLTDSSLLLMKGETQSNWLHGINKDLKIIKPRINLTFRVIKYSC